MCAAIISSPPDCPPAPHTQEVTDLVRAKGLFSFYEDGHTECCRVRKVSAVDVCARCVRVCGVVALAGGAPTGAGLPAP